MNNQIELIKTPDLREITAKIVRERPLTEDELHSVRHALDSMVQEASQYGFTEKDVIRAVFRPVLQKEMGCECTSCRTRREMEASIGEDVPEMPLGFD